MVGAMVGDGSADGVAGTVVLVGATVATLVGEGAGTALDGATCAVGVKVDGKAVVWFKLA